MKGRKIAILIDGGFFIRRLPKLVPREYCNTPEQVAETARHLCKRHVHRVPAAKLARREGVEFLLDPLWQKAGDDLLEHVDGIQSGLPQPETQEDDNRSLVS